MPTYQTGNTVTFSIFIYDNDGNVISATVSAAPSWVTGYTFTQSVLPDGRTEGILSVFGDLSGVTPGTYSITVRSTDGITPETVRTYPIYVQSIDAYSTPADIPNAKIWMSADGSTPNLETGDYVDTIPNLIPAHLNFRARQINEFRKPFFVENAVNGLPAWYFGSGSVMRINYPGAGDYSQNTSRTIIVVTKINRSNSTTENVFVQSGSVYRYNPSYDTARNNFGDIRGRYLWLFSMYNPSPGDDTHNLSDTDVPYFKFSGTTSVLSYSIMRPFLQVKSNQVEDWIYLNSSYNNPRVANDNRVTYPSGTVGVVSVPQVLDAFIDLTDWSIVTVVLENETGSFVSSLINPTFSSRDVLFDPSHPRYPADSVYINGVKVIDGKSGNRVEANMFLGMNLDGYIAEIAVFDRKLSNAERQNVENYLAKKYNIPYFVDPDEFIEEFSNAVVLRFDANTLTGSLQSGDLVPVWSPAYVKNADFTSYSLLQSTASLQPIFIQDAWNGLSGVVFRGNELMESELVSDVVTLSQPFAIGVVGSFASGGIFSVGDGVNNPHVSVVNPHVWIIGGASTEYSMSLAVRDPLIVAHFDYNASLNLNGVPLISNVAVGNDTLTKLRIGTDGIRNLFGTIYEIVVMQNPTRQDLRLLQFYLAARTFNYLNRSDIHAATFSIIK